MGDVPYAQWRGPEAATAFLETFRGLQAEHNRLCEYAPELLASLEILRDRSASFSEAVHYHGDERLRELTKGIGDAISEAALYLESKLPKQSD